MTNKEKCQYLNLSESYNLHVYEDNNIPWNDLDSKIPNALYKFRDFDNYTWEMIDKNYAYLASADDLDDPFDCLVRYDIDNLYKNNSSALSTNIIKFIVDQIINELDNKNSLKNDLQNLFKLYLQKSKLSKNEFIKEVKKISYLNDNDKEYLINFIEYSQNLLNVLLKRKELEELIANIKDSRKYKGVCSLTTKRDNKVMWSLYTNCYKGYCVEYKNIDKLEFLEKFKPVIYTSKFNNDDIKPTIKYFIENLKRILVNKNDVQMGIQNEILCYKDSNWSFQDEWRIIGKANTRYKMEINAIFLGFKTEKANEEKMKEYANQKGFSLYKMLDPKLTNKIKYVKLL